MWGDPVAEEVARTVSRRSGVRWLPAYGTSEVPVIAANPVQDPERWRLDSAGLAAGVRSASPIPRPARCSTPGPPVRSRCGAGRDGRVPPQLRDRGRLHDGWYRTGDIGWLEPEGWLHITDRLKEMIKVRGFQVAPAELEAVLHGDPHVHDCAVFGVDDAELGDAIVAAVVLAPGAQVTPEELQAVIADRPRGYKRVRHVVMVDADPVSSGKALRRQLKEAWISDRV